MSELKLMPTVTVEEIVRFRKSSLDKVEALQSELATLRRSNAEIGRDAILKVRGSLDGNVELNEVWILDYLEAHASNLAANSGEWRIMDNVEYLVTGEKFLPDSNIEKMRSVYSGDQLMNAQALIARMLLDDGYSRASIEVRPANGVANNG